jgi:hypothetical protein
VQSIRLKSPCLLNRGSALAKNTKIQPRQAAAQGSIFAARESRIDLASRQSAATRVLWGSIGRAEIFADGHSAHATKKWDVHCAGLARYKQGVVGG